MFLGFILFQEILGSEILSNSQQKRKLDFYNQPDHKISRKSNLHIEIPHSLKSNLHIEIPHSVKSKIISLALDSVINAMQHIKNRPIDSEISKGITQLHGLCFKKLNELAFDYNINYDKYELISKINEVRKIKCLEFDHMAIYCLDLCQMYSNLYDQNCLLISIDIYQRLTEKALALFTNEIRDDYFFRFWNGRILKSDIFENCNSKGLVEVQDSKGIVENYDAIRMILKRNQEELEYQIYDREQLNHI